MSHSLNPLSEVLIQSGTICLECNTPLLCAKLEVCNLRPREYTPRADIIIYLDRTGVAIQRYRPLEPSKMAYKDQMDWMPYPRQPNDYFLMEGCLDAPELIPAGASSCDDILVTIRGAEPFYPTSVLSCTRSLPQMEIGG